jgi:hypothetical protein
MEPDLQDTVLIKTIGTTISKMTLYVCCTIAMGMLISTCEINEKTILQCEESCGDSRGIREVTSTSCECNDVPKINSRSFVLPAK